MKKLTVLVAALVLVFIQFGLAGATSGGQAKKTVPTKIRNATFGAGPASAKQFDGRPYFNFTASPGARLVDHIAIKNLTHRPEKLTVYPVDATTAADGTIAFPQRGAPRTAAGAWLAVGTPGAKGIVNIKPRSTAILPVHVKIPTNASPGDHIGAIVVSFTGLVTGKFGSGSKQKVKFDQRIAVRAAFRISGPVHPSLTIQKLTAEYHGPIDPFARGYAQLHYVVHNGGNIVLGGPQTVNVSGLFGEHVMGPHVVAVPPLLPGASYPVRVRVQKVYPEVWMSAKVTIHAAALQGDVAPNLKPVTSSVHFLAIPWILLIVLLLVILGLGWLYRRRRRGSR